MSTGKRPSLKRPASDVPDEASYNIDRDFGLSHPTSEREAAVRKARPRQQPLYLTSQQQDDVVLWYQDHEFLYDKGHTDYKLTEKKTALWKEKAEDLGVCDGPRLRCWIDSVRTQYGKLTRRSPGGRLSHREKWILEKFSFLSKHIYRKPGRCGVDLMSKIREKHPEWIYDSQESDEEEENGDADELLISSPALVTVSEGTDTPASPIRNSQKKTSREESTASLQLLEAHIQHSSQTQERPFDRMSVPTDQRAEERHQWAQWFGAAIPEIDESLWPEFQVQSLQLVNTFKARSKRLQPAISIMQPVKQECVDYDTAGRLQSLNCSSSPLGYLPRWQQQQQQQYQVDQSPPTPTTLGRPHSASLSPTATSAAPAFSMDTVGPTYNTG